jgi:hypothetical protein
MKIEKTSTPQPRAGWAAGGSGGLPLVSVPAEALDDRIAIVGTAGSGKTYAAKGFVAHSDDVGRAFRLMSATSSDRSRPAVPMDVGRVAERPLVGGDLCITGCIGSSGGGFQSLLLA